MRRMALIVLLSLTLTASFVPTAEAATAAADDTLAPPCTGYIGVRCADGGEMCLVYVRRMTCLHL